MFYMFSMENPKNHMDNLMIFIDDLMGFWMGFWMVLDGFGWFWDRITYPSMIPNDHPK
jgi:hypothetical protein